jgi:hypothetical protein
VGEGAPAAAQRALRASGRRRGWKAAPSAAENRKRTNLERAVQDRQPRFGRARALPPYGARNPHATWL